jgi:hypothetical protein
MVTYGDYKGGVALRQICRNISSLTASSFSILSEAEIVQLRRLESLHEGFDRATRGLQHSDIFAVDAVDDFRDSVRLITDQLLSLLRRGIQRSEFEALEPSDLPPALPSDIRALLMASWGEACVSYEAECFMSAIAMCGRLIETHLNAICISELNLDPDSANLGFNATVNRIKKHGYALRAGLEEQMSLIAQHRNKAVHGSASVATRDQARGILALTRDVLLTTKK